MFEQRFAAGTAVLTFLLLLVGGIVHGTGSSLACPDWPTCYGTFFPEMKGGVFFEHSHRILAASVGFLTVVLAVLVWRRRQDRSLRSLSLGAVILVIFQGVLGGLTVIYKLPAAVSSAHLATSMIFFSLLIVLAFRLGEAGEGVPAAVPGGRKWVGLAGSLTFLQIALGGVVRHVHAGLACGNEIPLCQGSLWPWGAHPIVLVHMAHRLGGVAVAAALIGLALWLWRHAPSRGGVSVLALVACFLVVLQMTLGFLSVASFLNLYAVTSHLGVGALLLGVCVSMWMMLAGPPAAQPNVPAAAPVTNWRAGAADFLALTKPRITFMVLVTAAGGFWLAPGRQSAMDLLFLLAGTGLVVGGANALNMYLEREIDGRMARTQNRPLPAGRMAPRAALWTGLLLPVLGLPVLFCLVNVLTGTLVTLSLLLYVLVYTPLKQKSSTALLAGAVPGAIPPLVGWTAATDSMDLPGLVLFALMFLWQVPHFLAIALFRKEDYARAGLQLLPLEASERATKVQIVLYLAALLPVSILLYTLEVAGKTYLFGAAVLGMVFLGWGLRGMVEETGPRWARQLFVISLVYLTLLFAILVIDRVV